ncbi:MAG: NPCBM/NEW2 domain-containing protein, partial [Candidatus Hydrogenedentes bacterium]|nr:NPCBM/NEW2 domain-containing protein [Candidatus Hydrogenedentota bacterium]
MNRLFCGVVCAVLCAVAYGEDASAPWSDAPLPVAEYEDAIMASPAEVGEMRDWAASSFRGVMREGAAPRVELEVLRQDHSVLRFNESCIETPLMIGTKSFEHGLGTHATSEISVKVPKDAARFMASVGIDNNHDTQGTRGSVQFSVEIAGAEVFRTPTVHGGEEPVAVDVNVPESTDRITLKVDATEDGASHDQANWADAR